MSEIKINWKKHVEKYKNAMNELNLDFCVLTRVKSLTYLTGAFVPWRSAIFLPKEGAGEPILFTVLLDVERCKVEGEMNVDGWGPMKVTFGKEWGHMVFEEGMVEIAAIVFNNPKIGGLRLESPTLVTSKGAEVLPKTPFEVDYI